MYGKNNYNNGRIDFSNAGNNLMNFRNNKPNINYNYTNKEPTKAEIMEAREKLSLLKTKMSNTAKYNQGFANNNKVNNTDYISNNNNKNNYRKVFKPNLNNENVINNNLNVLEDNLKINRNAINDKINNFKNKNHILNDIDDMFNNKNKLNNKPNMHFNSKVNLSKNYSKPIINKDNNKPNINFDNDYSKSNTNSKPVINRKEGYKPNMNLNNNNNEYNINNYINNKIEKANDEVLPTSKANNNVTNKMLENMESEYSNVELFDCPMNCGRRFNEKALKVHAKNCKKVFQSKRKQFDVKEMRKNEELANFENENKYYNKKNNKKNTKNTEKNTLPANKIPKWKKDSNALRNIINANKKNNNNNTNFVNNNNIEEYEEIDDRIECQYCNRKFNDTAAKRHIPICREKHKLNLMKANGKKNTITRK